MGIGIVLVMLCVLAVFLMSSFLKARLYNKQSWGRSILLALESPTCFLTVSRLFIVYSWKRPLSLYGELPSVWDKIEMGGIIIADWIRAIPLLHSVTISSMVELTRNKSLHTVGDVLHKNGVFVLSK